MSDALVPLSKIALRVSESNPDAWWLVVVPAGEVSAMVQELEEELESLGSSARSGSLDDPRPGAGILLLPMTPALANRVDALRNELAGQGAIVLVIAESDLPAFRAQAPHVASFIGGKLFESSVEDAQAPPQLVERRLESLRQSYGMSDDEAREAVRLDQAPNELDFIEWMVLLGDEGER